MSLEQAINKLADAINNLAAAGGGGTSVTNVAGGRLADAIEAADTAATTTGATEPPKRGRGRPPATENKPADTKPADPPPAAEEVDPFADPSEPKTEKKPATIEDVRRALIDLSKTKKDKATAILNACTNKDGKPCATIGEIAPADYDKVIAEVAKASAA